MLFQRNPEALEEEKGISKERAFGAVQSFQRKEVFLSGFVLSESLGFQGQKGRNAVRRRGTVHEIASQGTPVPDLGGSYLGRRACQRRGVPSYQGRFFQLVEGDGSSDAERLFPDFHLAQFLQRGKIHQVKIFVGKAPEMQYQIRAPRNKTKVFRALFQNVPKLFQGRGTISPHGFAVFPPHPAPPEKWEDIPYIGIDCPRGLGEFLHPKGREIPGAAPWQP